MFGSAVLDVAIGLIFLYLFLGLLCSAACELIETFWRGRARYLHLGLHQMLDDLNGQSIVPAIYEHPLVNSLFSGRYSPHDQSNLPSYIPSETFAIALMDIMSVSGSGAYGVPSSGYPAEVSPPFADRASRFGSGVSQALKALSDPESNDPVRLRLAIVGWYNSAMENTSGTYKRRTQLVLLCVAGALVLAINADTFDVARSLAIDSSVRQVLVASAIDQAKAPVSDLPKDSVAWDSLKPIRERSEPLGWSSLTAKLRGDERPPFSFWLLKMLGLLLTTLSIVFTGPLCFDTLSRIMMVRCAVKPKASQPNNFPESSGNEYVPSRFIPRN